MPFVRRLPVWSNSPARTGDNLKEHIMKRLLLAATALIGLGAMATPSEAVLITSFAQTSNTNTVTATDSAGVTHLAFTNASVLLGGGILGVIPGAVMTLSANSTDTATLVAGNIVQHYSGSFCISSLAGCTGNFLQGTFVDAAFGAAGGPGLVVNVNNPPESLTMTSNVIPASELVPPSTFNLTFASLSNPLSIVGNSIGNFTAAFSGTISASEAIPEPASLALLGVGMLGLGLVRRRSV